MILFAPMAETASPDVVISEPPAISNVPPPCGDNKVALPSYTAFHTTLLPTGIFNAMAAPVTPVFLPVTVTTSNTSSASFILDCIFAAVSACRISIVLLSIDTPGIGKKPVFAPFS
jgi:hypothetical protein